jgi:autotransporter-associated beta strand protein
MLTPLSFSYPCLTQVSRKGWQRVACCILVTAAAFAQNPQDFYTRTGTDPTFQQLIDSGVIVPGESSGTGPVNGSTIDVNNALLEAQTGNLGNLPTDFRIHTQINSSVLRGSFGNFRRWYQEDGRIQVMRLFQGEQNIRSGVGAEGTPGRIEAFYPPFAVPLNKWSVWQGTYTIIDPLQSNIFQLFHEGGQLWAFHLRMTNSGTIYFARRRAISGLPTEITIASNMAGKSISFMVRANGTQYELYKRNPFPLENWELVTTGSYTAAVDRRISFRWGMYYGSQAGQSIPNDGLLFMNGISLSSIDAPGGEPPPPPPPVPMTYYWDNNGATAGFGTASGVWGETTSGGTQGWSTDSTGATLPGEVSTNTVDTLFFGTDASGRGLGAGTIQVSDTVAAADITFGSQSGSITLNGGEIEMPGNRTISVPGTGRTYTIRSDIKGDGALNIAGGCTLSLTGANTFVGPITLGDNSSGSLRLRLSTIGNSNGTPTAAGAPTNASQGLIQIGSVSNGSTLELSASPSAQSTNRQIRIGSNSGGSGGATILNNNTNAANTLTFTNASFNVAATDNTSFNRSLTLGGSNTGDNIIQGAIIDNIGGSGGKISLSKTGNSTWVLAGNNAYTGGTSIDAGTLRIGNGGTTGSLSTSSSITNNSILEFRRSNTLTQGSNFSTSAITGSGQIIQSGTGTTILNVNNTYQGLTTVRSGAIRIENASALGDTSAGTIVEGSGTGSSVPRLELAGGISVSGEPISISGGGNFLGALTSQSGTNTWAGPVTVTAAGTRIGAHDGATLRVSGIIGSGGQPHGLTVRTSSVDTSAVVLSAANTYAGDTSLVVGKLQLDGGNNRLPVGTRLIMGNTTNHTEFDLNGRHQTVAGISIASGVTTGVNTIRNSSATPSTLTVNTASGSPSSFSGIIAGNLAISKSGGDQLLLTGANTYTGGTTLTTNGGTVQARITQTATGLGTGSVNVGSGSTLLLENQSTTSAPNLPLINNTFTGSGLLQLQFAAGTTARNTYMPNVTGFNGVIQLSNTGATGDKWNAANLGTIAGSLLIDAGTTIFVNSGTTSFSGGITINGAGNSEARGAIRVSGGSTIVGGNIRLASNATIGMENVAGRITGNITSISPGNHVLTLGGPQGSQAGGRLEGNISDGTGTLHLTVANGHYTLSGNHSYTGATTVQGGILSLVGASMSSPITLSSAARLGFTLGSPVTSSSSIHLGQGQIRISGTVDGTSNYTLITAHGGITGTGILEAAIPGYELRVRNSGTQLILAPIQVTPTFEDWSQGALPEADDSGDGIPNLIAYALGAETPSQSARDLLPQLSQPAGSEYVHFTFPRSHLAASDPSIQFTVQFSTALNQWNPALPDGNNIIMEVEPGDDRSMVTVKVKRSLAPQGRMFLRLQVTRTSP